MNFIELESCESTQDEALKFLSENTTLSRVWIRALSQTGGRGRHSREWISPKGNLYLSGAFRIPESHKSLAWPFISLIVGQALAQTLDQHKLWKEGVFLKWPNDVFFFDDSDFFKLGGILCELKSSILVVGVGLNFKNMPIILSTQSLYKSLSFEDLCCTLPDLNSFAQDLANSFERLFDKFCDDAFVTTKECLTDLHEKWMTKFFGFEGRESSSKRLVQPLQLGHDGRLECRYLDDNTLVTLSSGEFQLERLR